MSTEARMGFAIVCAVELFVFAFGIALGALIF